MTGVTTGQTSLPTATDSDDNEGFLTGPLTTALQTLANLFDSITGHDHTGAGKGKPVGSAGIASGVALTSPVVGGAGGTPAGTLGFSGTVLQVGDGTFNAGINVGAWTAFVPTLSQGVVVTATVNVAHYLKQGRRVEIFIELTATSAGTAAQNIIVSALPAAILPLTNNTAVITGLGYVNAGSIRIGALCAFTSGQLEILVDNAGVVGVNPAVTLANGSIVTMWGSWETAS